ncbi:aldehyde ferredoxin oxidoreductase N-terminal domain-containing protein [Chloroflexota bacterium]
MTEGYGYAGNILRIDLSSGKISRTPTAEYADRFLGGRGIAAKIYWDEVPANVSAFDPENRLIFATGPLAGFSGLSGSRWQVCGKAPAMTPEEFSYCNLGGRWGGQLKFAGYDGLVIQGKSYKPVYVFIDDDAVEIRNAAELWGKSTVETREILKDEVGRTAAVVACGPAGENLVSYAIVLADNDASGSSGFGAVMGSKNLKAIAVKGSGRVTPANPGKFKEVKEYIRQLLYKGPGYMEAIAKPEAHIETVPGQKVKLDLCLGCAGFDGRVMVESRDGRKKGKSLCGSSLFYLDRVGKFYEERNEVPFYVNRLCDEYGVDALAIESMMKWLSRCRHTGILTDESTGIPLSKVGSWEYMEALVTKMSLREGFGDVLAQGIQRAAAVVGPEATELVADYVSKAGHLLSYCPRTFPAHSLLYAMEPRQAVNQLHEMGLVLFQWVNWARGLEGAYLSSDVFRKIAARFWGSELAADFSTYDGKALAAARIQDREYAKECLILCDFTWPVTHTLAGDHVGDPSIDSIMLSAVTGAEVTEEELYYTGERVYNLQRAIHIREGHKGRESDMIPDALFTMPLKGHAMNPQAQAPGKDGEITSRIGMVVDRGEFERMKGEYYELRGWDKASGLQTKEKLEELDLPEVAQELGTKGLAL